MTAAPSRRRAFVAFAVAAVLTALGVTVQSLSSSVSAQDAPALGPQGETGQGGGEPPRGAPGGAGARQPAPPADAASGDGRALYLTSCVNCHGAGGAGTVDGPPLTASGEARTDFYLRTGRMPLTVPVPQPPAKLPAFNDAQIRDLVAYVGSLCDRAVNECTAIPTVDLDRARIQEGQRLFLGNCAPCHNSAAVGGALSFGRNAPSLQQTPPTQVAEAVRTGPGQMPRFGPDVLDDGQVDAIVKYVQYLHEPENPGGLPLGYTGPVAEGFVALLLGLSAMVLAARWITREPAPTTAGKVDR
jgi:ubiquinol-cytochrome c reductase cytochrome c subunit